MEYIGASSRGEENGTGDTTSNYESFSAGGSVF